jgi:hypothetical protein
VTGKALVLPCHTPMGVVAQSVGAYPASDFFTVSWPTYSASPQSPQGPSVPFGHTGGSHGSSWQSDLGRLVTMPVRQSRRTGNASFCILPAGLPKGDLGFLNVEILALHFCGVEGCLA